MDIFKHLLLDDQEIEWNFYKSVQDLLENYDQRGDGKVDFRYVEVVEAWLILKRRAYEELLFEIQELNAPDLSDLAELPTETAYPPAKQRKPRRRKNCAVCKTPLVGKQRVLCSSKSCSNKHYKKKK